MRSAQDDDFVGALKKKIQTRLRFNVLSPRFSLRKVRVKRVMRVNSPVSGWNCPFWGALCALSPHIDAQRGRARALSARRAARRRERHKSPPELLVTPDRAVSNRDEDQTVDSQRT